MAISKKSLREKKKKEVMEMIMGFLDGMGEQTLIYKSNEFSFPITLEDGEEEFIQIVVKIPTGANKGTEPFDGYAEHDNYLLTTQSKAEQKAAAEAAKKKKIAKDEEYRKKKAEMAKAKEGK